VGGNTTLLHLPFFRPLFFFSHFHLHFSIVAVFIHTELSIYFILYFYPLVRSSNPRARRSALWLVDPGDPPPCESTFWRSPLAPSADRSNTDIIVVRSFLSLYISVYSFQSPFSHDRRGSRRGCSPLCSPATRR
jgi:hypothetical protein